jgi:hypothetical protein
MKKTITILSLVLLLSCSSSNDFNKGKKQLENQGYTNIVNTGHKFFCCGEDDEFSTGFKALDSKGYEVEGCFCSSILKGVTIRFK